MNNTGRRSDRMSPKASSPVMMFDKVLQAFEDGDIRFGDVQLDLRRILASEASPQELLEVLERREAENPLPQYAYVEILRLLNEAVEQAAALHPDSDPAQDPIENAVAVDMDAVLGRTLEPAQPPAGPAHSLAERLAHQNADYQAMTLAYERARDAGSAAAARATALAAELNVAAERYHTEMSSLRDALAARDAALVEGRLALAERAEQLAVLQKEHAKTVAALEARAKLGAQLESDLHAEHARGVALAADQKAESDRTQAELRTLRDSLAARDASVDRMRLSLGEREAQLAELQREHAKMVPALEARVTDLEGELRAARARIDAMTSELKEAQQAVAMIDAQRERGESHLMATRSKLNAVQAQSSSYLELLRTREWRWGFDQNRFREADEADEAAADAGSTALQAECDRLRAEAASLRTGDTQHVVEFEVEVPPRASESAARIGRLDVQNTPRRETPPRETPPRETPTRAAAAAGRPAQKAALPRSARPALHAALSLLGRGGPRKPGGPWKPGELARTAAGIGAAILVVAVIAWFYVRHVPAAVKAPAVSFVFPEPGTVIRDCPTCPALTVLPPGRFKQGPAGAESGSTALERPLHWVMIAHPFAMSTNAVTVDEFRAFIAATGRDMQGCDTYDGEWRHRAENDWQNPGFDQAGSHPVTCASWNDAEAYAAWLSAKTGHRYRLPSASEWEYAARAGGDAVRPWNADGSGACASANVADASAARRYPGWTVFACDDGYVYTAPVGSFKASSFGLNDMLGNVFQWTEDCWHADYVGAPIDGSARLDGDCSEHELRGGSWFSTPSFVRADYRNHFGADYRTSTVGIRLVRDLSP